METDNNEQEKPWFNLAAASQVRMPLKPLNIRWIGTGSLSNTKKLCIVSYYRQFSTNIKILIIKLPTVLLALVFGLSGLPKLNL